MYIWITRRAREESTLLEELADLFSAHSQIETAAAAVVVRRNSNNAPHPRPSSSTRSSTSRCRRQTNTRVGVPSTSIMADETYHGPFRPVTGSPPLHTLCAELRAVGLDGRDDIAAPTSCEFSDEHSKRRRRRTRKERVHPPQYGRGDESST